MGDPVAARKLGILLAVAGAVIVGLLIALWLQIRSPVQADLVQEAAATGPAPSVAETVPDVVRRRELAAIAAQAVAVSEQAGKVDPASDEFFHRFYDLQPAVLTRNAAKCYTGGLSRVHRNSKVKLTFTNRITNGEVTVENVAVSPDTTITDQQLIDCFLREVQGTRWRDDTLPNWSGPDELVIRPERGMKKFAEDNVKYEGDGPDFGN